MAGNFLTTSLLYLSSFSPIVLALLFLVLGMVLVKLFDMFVVKKLTAKKNRSNFGVFVHAFRYVLFLVLILYLVQAYTTPGTDYSIIIGLVSAALGFALAKPITGIAAWLVIILKKPFYIGDRIIVGDVKGDVIDITLSHIVLNEIGGTVSSEDQSGRVIHIPTLVLFEENVINYTLDDEYILDEITILVTYESNLEKAEYIIQKSGNKVLKLFNQKSKQAPYIRLFFDESGINIKLRYFVSASRRQEISSDIIRLIHDGFNKESGIEIAYPHIQFVPTHTPMKKKSQFVPTAVKKKSKKKSSKRR